MRKNMTSKVPDPTKNLKIAQNLSKTSQNHENPSQNHKNSQNFMSMTIKA